MENGYLVDTLTNEGEEEWQSIQDLSPRESEPLSSGSEPVSVALSEPLQVDIYSGNYDLGSFAGYSVSDYGLLLGTGACVGFAVAVCIALASWAVMCGIQILRKGGN